MLTRRRLRSGRLGGDDGLSVLLVGLALVPLLVLSAFVVDLGNARQETRLAQTASDAAALAGAADLPIPSDSAAVKSAAPAAVKASAAAYAASNTVGSGVTPGAATCQADAPANASCYRADDVDVTVATPYTGGSFGIDASSLVYVEICWPTVTFFGSVVGWTSPRVCRDSVARRQNSSGGYDYGLVALHPSQCAALIFAGDSDTVLSSNGAVMVNSDCTETTPYGALDASGSKWRLVSNFIGVVGTATLNPCDPTVNTSCTQTEPTTGIPSFPDPLGDLDEPEPTGSAQVCAGGSNGEVQTLLPGYYNTECRITKGDVRMQPGQYVFKAGFTMNGGSLTCDDSATGEVTCENTGVLLFVKSGALTLNGNGLTDLPPYQVDPYAGLSVWQAEANGEEASVNGTADGVSLGTIYIPGAHLKANGTGDLSIYGMVVADTIGISGSFDFTITVPDDAPDITPLEDIGLVE